MSWIRSPETCPRLFLFGGSYFANILGRKIHLSTFHQNPPYRSFPSSSPHRSALPFAYRTTKKLHHRRRLPLPLLRLEVRRTQYVFLLYSHAFFSPFFPSWNWFANYSSFSIHLFIQNRTDALFELRFEFQLNP